MSGFFLIFFSLTFLTSPISLAANNVSVRVSVSEESLSNVLFWSVRRMFEKDSPCGQGKYPISLDEKWNCSTPKLGKVKCLRNFECKVFLEEQREKQEGEFGVMLKKHPYPKGNFRIFYLSTEGHFEWNSQRSFHEDFMKTESDYLKPYSVDELKELLKGEADQPPQNKSRKMLTKD